MSAGPPTGHGAAVGTFCDFTGYFRTRHVYVAPVRSYPRSFYNIRISLPDKKWKGMLLVRVTRLGTTPTARRQGREWFLPIAVSLKLCDVPFLCGHLSEAMFGRLAQAPAVSSHLTQE